MTDLKLVPKAPLDLQGQIRGFCTTKEARKVLSAQGLPDLAIYQLGAGAEDMAACLKSYRDRPGWLILAQDLRVFGPSKRDVANRTDALEKAGIRILDVTHPQDLTYAAMVQRANVLISGSRFQNRRKAKSMGRAGGLGKGHAANRERNELAPEWLVDRIVDNPNIPWGLKIDLLHPHFTESTLRRHYGFKAAIRRA